MEDQELLRSASELGKVMQTINNPKRSHWL
jgi:hypothetical protein